MRKEITGMIVKDDAGNELLEVIFVSEEKAEKQYAPIACALVVVKVGNEYLMGWNKWRNDWEIFGGCKEEGETLRECIMREGYEELGLRDVEYTYIGLMKCKMAPGYFNPEWHEEYGGIYGITLPSDMLETIEVQRVDREEIERLVFYKDIDPEEKIARIDEALLKYWS